MLRRVLAPALMGLGAVVIALAIASATLWRPADELVATAGGLTGSHYLVTEPGVLDLAADDVAVTAVSVSGARVVVAFATSADIDAWLAGAPSTRVTGLTRVDGVEALTTELRESPEPADAADPSGADLWRWETTGTGRVAFDWDREPGRLGILVWSEASDATDLSLTLAWPQEVRTPWLVPGIALGSLLLVAGLALLAWRIRAARAERERRAALEATAELAAVTGAPLTRRQLREAQRLAEGRARPEADPEAAGAAAVPTAVGAQDRPDAGDRPASDAAPPAGATDPSRPMTRRERRLAAAAAATPSTPEPAEDAAPPAPATPEPAPTAPEPPPIAVAPVPRDVPEEPAPAERRRRRSLLDRWRRPEPAPEPEPEPEPEVEWFPEPPPTTSASADAWRRAWGFPGVGSDATGTTTTTTDAADAAATSGEEDR